MSHEPTVVSYTGNGTQTNFTFPFDYISRDYVKVQVNFVDVAFTFVNTNEVSITPAPAAGATIRIFRQTTTNDIVEFSFGPLLAAQLNKADRQLLHLLQERIDFDNAVGFPDLPTAEEAFARAEEAILAAEAVDDKVDLFRPKLLQDYGFPSVSFTTAMLAAGADLKANGGVLQLPAGTFSLTAPLIFHGTGNAAFTIRGMGRDLTVIRRDAAFAQSIISVRDNTGGFTLEDLTIDGRESALPGAIHGIRLERTPNAVVQRVALRDWASTGIIHFDGDNPEALYKNVKVLDCDLHGTGIQNNGILLANTDNGVMRGCRVLNLGSVGSPTFALQFKLRNVNGIMSDCYAENALAGVAIGSEEVANPSNEYITVSNVIVRGCREGVRAAFAQYLNVSNVIIDSTGASAPEYALSLRFVLRSSFRGIQILNLADTSLAHIRVRASDANTIEVATLRNVPTKTPVVAFEAASSGNTIEIGNYIGTVPLFAESIVTREDLNRNTFLIRNIPVLMQVNLQTVDTFSVLNPALVGVEFTHDTDGVTRDLRRIEGTVNGHTITLKTANSARDVRVLHAAPSGGNIFLRGAANFTLDNTWRQITLQYSVSTASWHEV